MAEDDALTPHQRWANFRFGVVAPLLTAPPASGKVGERLRAQASQEWSHPITGQPVWFGFSTIERWYHQSRRSNDPVKILRRKVRRDKGRQRALSAAAKEVLNRQYQEHPSWSVQLHYDNLAALFRAGTLEGDKPSYPTVRRFMKVTGLVRQRRRGKNPGPGVVQAERRLEQREVRSFEVADANALWHLDFHHGSRQVNLPNGQWVTPLLLGILDDHSRLVCHIQWYLAENAENLIHGLCQAIQKRGLPRALMTDNGAAMLAGETRQGLTRLGIQHETTLPYSPYQNGKQEVFWGQVEGRLIAMLEQEPDLSLDLLNQATQAWVEQGYHRAVHSETGETPINRFLAARDLGRPSPESQPLRDAFMCQESRTQRRSDGTLSLGGVRFELPGRYRALARPTVRFARWNLSRALLVDPSTDTVLATLLPQDKTSNADGLRRSRETETPEPEPMPAKSGMAPLLREMLIEYAATGLPPAFLHQPEILPGEKKS